MKSELPVELHEEKRTLPEKGALTRDQVLEDYRFCALSRAVSGMVRKEVHAGRAKFGLEGSGKEVPQVAMARAFQKGDFYSGYYRDQTFMMAKGISSVPSFFAALFSDSENDPFSGGRQMNNHFSTPFIDENGHWTRHVDRYNVASALAPLGSHIPHALGIALGSKQYKEIEVLKDYHQFSRQGNEVSICVMGDATTAEGVFFESVNAAGVMKVPIAFVILDDGYGISVPSEYQTTKGSISEVLAGFSVNEEGEGIDIYTAKAWDYPGLQGIFQKGIARIRETYTPAVFHIKECTQVFGHSTSGSHERYKSPERLEWEREVDCIKRMRIWMIKKGVASEAELDAIEEEAQREAKAGKEEAWRLFRAPLEAEKKRIQKIYHAIETHSPQTEKVRSLASELEKKQVTALSHLVENAHRMRMLMLGEKHLGIEQLRSWLDEIDRLFTVRFQKHLYSETERSALRVPEVPALYSESPRLLSGYEILNVFFDHALEKHPEVSAFGEDVGMIGDVNQGFKGLQKKYGEERVFDTGIREWTIVGQAIGMAMRGLRPIAEIQYLDYLAYAFSPLTDNLATLRHRTNGKQMAPAIIRTRGHRLEGIWHSGSPMGMIVNSMRGIWVLVPRNMVQAAGMYNTMLQSDDPAIIVECLNGYRLKEQLPDNIGEFTVPLGKPDILRQGRDVTLVTYGSCVRIAESACSMLAEKDISVELIDVQTLLPFDIDGVIVDSLKRTNRIVFLDEDVPGGCTAYMMQEVLEKQKGYNWLDSAPVTVTAKSFRPPYGDDGDYFTKPYEIDVYKAIYEMMHEVSPHRFPF